MNDRVELPTGTVTFLFSDIEGSTRLLQRLGDRYPDILERHHRLLRDAFDRHGGLVVGTEGDSFFAVFPSAPSAVMAAVAAQLSLAREAWPEGAEVQVRMGLHTGQGTLGGENYVGVDVHRAARIAAAGHGGQVLISSSTQSLVERDLPEGTTLIDRGEHHLKDLLRPERIFQVAHPELRSDFPPLVSLSRRPNNLPVQTSEFLGREAELRAIRALLDDPAVRLLTLTGPGGIGKTRLALQAAADQIDGFEDGSYFVELSAARDADAVFEAIVRAVGVNGAGEVRPLEVLTAQLAGRHMLLLLDNFEQVMDAAEGVVELLHRSPRLVIVVTSREPLGVRGEHLFPVSPLSVPPERGAEVSAATVGAYEAVLLFVARAGEVRPGFALIDDNAAAVAKICARLDGLPLAIELAAARLVLFSLDDLRDRLGNRLDLLRRRRRDLPPRQQTLRSTIEWSYELLDPQERTMFRLLSVFSSARLEAVEAIAAQLGALQDVDVIEGIESLVEKSLVRTVEGPGPTRVSMLETIREYAAERLDEDPALSEATCRAHAAFFSRFAIERRDELDGPSRERALDALSLDIDELMTAWRFWVERGELEKLDELFEALWVLHDSRGWYTGAVELARDLLGVLSSVPSSPDRVKQTITLATGLARGLLALRGYTAEVDEAYRRALAMIGEAGGLPRLFPVLRSVASFHLYRGEFDKAVAVGRELLDLADQEDDVGLQVEGHLILGANLASLGDASTGLDHLDRAIALFDPERHRTAGVRLGPSPGVVPYTTSAFFLWSLGYPERAVDRASRGLDLAQRLNHPFTLAYALFHVGFLDLMRRELELVRERAEGVLEIAEDHGYEVWRALALVLHGVAMTGLGEQEDGLARSAQGIGLYRGLPTPPVFWPPLLTVRAVGLAMGGRPKEALEVMDQVLELYSGAPPNVLYPDAPLLKGDLLLMVSGPEAAEPWFQHAFDVADEVGARLPQLRAAMRLTQLWRAAGVRAGGIDILRRVYDTFTEGFDTPDLAEARGILETATPA
ncbi:MAG: ATP-binding protein [Actinomycetota bacterium]